MCRDALEWVRNLRSLGHGGGSIRVFTVVVVTGREKELFAIRVYERHLLGSALAVDKVTRAT